MAYEDGMWWHSLVCRYRCFKGTCCLHLLEGFVPWRWRQQVPLKHQHISTTLQSVTYQQTAMFTVISVRTSNLTSWNMMNINTSNCLLQRKIGHCSANLRHPLIHHQVYVHPVLLHIFFIHLWQMPLISALNADARQNVGWQVATLWLPEKMSVFSPQPWGKLQCSRGIMQKCRHLESAYSKMQ